jgi:hypothetical protein
LPATKMFESFGFDCELNGFDVNLKLIPGFNRMLMEKLRDLNLKQMLK